MINFENLASEVKDLSEKRSYVRVNASDLISRINDELAPIKLERVFYETYVNKNSFKQYGWGIVKVFSKKRLTIVEVKDYDNSRFTNTGRELDTNLEVRHVTTPLLRDLLNNLPEFLKKLQVQLEKNNEKYDEVIKNLDSYLKAVEVIENENNK